MKTMAILGIIISAWMMILCLTMIAETGVVFVFVTYGFFLALSILALKSIKK